MFSLCAVRPSRTRQESSWWGKKKDSGSGSALRSRSKSKGAGGRKGGDGDGDGIIVRAGGRRSDRLLRVCMGSVRSAGGDCRRAGSPARC